MVEAWILVAYVVGTMFGYMVGRGKVMEVVSHTIDKLVSDGFIQTRKTDDGEIELLKWYEPSKRD